MSAGSPKGLEGRFAVQRRHFVVEADLALGPGERLALYGTSGAGKSTILEAIAGAVRLDEGSVVLDGLLVNAPRRRRLGRRDGGGAASAHPERPELPVVPERQRSISLVRQPTTLFPHLSVARNVGYGLGRDDGQAGVLEAVGLAALADVPAARLSGGQRQRVALARAVGRGFRALLLDEPFSAVDVAARPGLRRLAEQRIDEEAGVGVLVTHALTEAQAFGHRLAVIDEGHILQTGDPHELVLAPASRRVAELCGYTAFVPAPAGGLFALHPERFRVGAAPDLGPVLEGVVIAVQGFGPRWACVLEVPAGATKGAYEIRLDQTYPVGTPLSVTAIRPPIVASVADWEQ